MSNQEAQYKISRAGRIPIDWESAKISKLVKSLNAGVSVNSESRKIAHNEIGILKTSCLNEHHFNPDENKAVVENERDRVTLSVKKDSIIISRMNTMELVGLSAYIPESYPYLFLPDRLWQTENTNYQFSPLWLSYVLATKSFRNQIKTIATGTSGSMKNITQTDFLNLPIPLPPLDEQCKIAEILRTWDEAITLTERLIAALEQRKKGLMQRLLTGQLRFPGFTDPWREVKLGEIADVTSGFGFPNIHQGDLFGDFPFFKVSDMNTIGNEQFLIKANNYVNKNILDTNHWSPFEAHSIVFPKVGETIRTNKKRKLNQPSLVDNNLMVVTNFHERRFIFDYVYFVFETVDLTSFTNFGAVPSIRSSDVKKFKIELPNEKEREQIVSVLLLTYHQIKLYKKKLNLFVNQKQGLMQRLLSGQVRVNV